MERTTVAATAAPSLPAKPLASLAYVGLAVGVALFTAVIAYQGFREVAAALTVAGSGLLVVALFHLAPLLTNALGWRWLFGESERLPVRTLVWARWIAESVNGLLPVMQVGGNLVRAQMIARCGVAGTAAGASVVVDITLNILSQVLFTFLGLCLLLVHLGAGEFVGPVVVGMMLMVGMVTSFYLVQRRGLFGAMAGLLDRITQRLDWRSLASEAATLDASVHRLYGDRRAIAMGTFWHLLSWILGAGEVWLALYFLGHPVSLTTAVLWESLGQALRTAAFAVPGALGVQEGGFVVLGSWFGIPPPVALALSLAKRVRELLLGVPGLVAWQVQGAATLLTAGAGARVGEGE